MEITIKGLQGVGKTTMANRIKEMLSDGYAITIVDDSGDPVPMPRDKGTIVIKVVQVQ